MLAILRRSDAELFYITVVSDVIECQQRVDSLCNMQAFTVEVVALLKETLETHSLLDEIAEHHVMNSWYKVPLATFLQLWIETMPLETKQTMESRESMESAEPQDEALLDPTDDSYNDRKLLPCFLSVCDVKAAPKSTIVKKEIISRLDREHAKKILALFEHKFVRNGGMTFRILTYNGQGIRINT